MPAGIIACFRPLTDASLFLVLYGAAAVYFSGVMVSCTSHCAHDCYTTSSTRMDTNLQINLSCQRALRSKCVPRICSWLATAMAAAQSHCYWCTKLSTALC